MDDYEYEEGPAAKAQFGSTSRDNAEQLFARQIPARSSSSSHSRKRNKKRPREVSSKIETVRFRKVVPMSANKVRDPRFDPLCGSFNEKHFQTKYAFLEDYRDGEIKELKERMHKIRSKAKKKGKRATPRDAEALRSMQTELTKLQQTQAKTKRDRKFTNAKSKIMAAERKKVAAGVKRPYYMKKSELKKLQLTQRYEELKSRGKLDKFMVKRRKKNAAKDRRMVPGA